MTAVVVGGVNVDMLATPAARLIAGVSNPGRIRIAAGGAGRNVAENLARLGVSTRLFASVDADPLSDLAITQAAKAGVDTSNVVRVPERGNYYVAIEDAGAVQWAVSDMSAAEALTPGMLDAHASVFQAARVVVVDANLAPATILRAAELAAGRLLCVVPVSAAKAPRIRGVLSRAGLLVLGVREATALTGKQIASTRDALRTAQALQPSAGSTVVLTMGAQGLGWSGTESFWTDALPGPVVDPSGAGDVVAAVAVYALLMGLDPRQAARLASAAAAMTIAAEGATHPGLSLDALHRGAGSHA